MEATVPFEDLVGNFDLAIDHVAVDLDIAGTLFGPHRAHHVVKFARGAARIGEHARGAGNFLIDTMLRFDLAGLMMDERAELALLLARAAREDQKRHAL